MSTENAPHLTKGQLKHYSSKECVHCKEMVENQHKLTETIKKQNDTIMEILAEHKVLLDRLLSQNAAVTTILNIFPINSEEKLAEFNEMLSAQSIVYIKHLKTLIKGNVERNLDEILGTDIIMSFNVEGTFGKKRLRKYENVYAALIDAISSVSAEPDKTLKAAFQRQKKKIFKQKSRNKQKQKENIQSGAGSLLVDEETESS